MSNHVLTGVVGVVCLVIGAVVSGVAVYFIAMPMEAEGPLKAKCMLQTTEGNSVSGLVMFEQESADEEIMIDINVTGLTAGKHGFHIHTLGSQDGQCKMAAGHYNPHDMTHGAPDSEARHIGDLGNIMSEGDTLTLKITDSIASLFGVDSIYGRSIVIHAGEDNLSSASASGDAGARVACCTIMHS